MNGYLVCGLFLAPFALMGVLFAVLTIRQRRRDREATKISQAIEEERVVRLTDLAAELGMEFSEVVEPEYLCSLDGKFWLTGYSSGFGFKVARIHNLMEAETDDYWVGIFDYAKWVRKNSRSWIECEQSVILFRSKRLDLPKSVYLRQEKMLDLFGAQYKFKSHPEFSNKYTCMGQPKEAMYDLLSDDVLTFFEQLSGYDVEGSGRRLLVYPHVRDLSREIPGQGIIADHRLPPESLRDFLETARTVFEALRDR